MDTTPALYHLLGAYLNQDWFDFYATEDDAVDAYVKETPDLVDRLPNEIDELVAQYSTDPELELYLDSIGCEYRPSADLGYREWLRQIADRVRALTSS